MQQQPDHDENRAIDDPQPSSGIDYGKAYALLIKGWLRAQARKTENAQHEEGSSPEGNNPP